jgi:plastocyanin domain-containing protein
MTKKIFIGLGIIISLIIGIGLFTGSSDKDVSENNDNSSVSTNKEGVQVVEIKAKGGYTPSRLQATEGKETVIRFTTNNTYDCSAAMTIPDLGISEFLEPNGAKEIVVSGEDATGDLLITCSMGMYSSTINFS